MSARTYDNVVLSRPMTIIWGGWESTTTMLQQNGWQLSLQRDVYRMEMRVAMRHKTDKIYGLTAPIRDDFVDRIVSQNYGSAPMPVAHVQYMASKLTVTAPVNMSTFEPIDAMPQLGSIEVKDIEDFNIFAAPLVRTEEIIVEPETVADMLEKIKAMQSTGQDEIRERNRMRELREGGRIDVVPQHKFHAQILSFG